MNFKRDESTSVVSEHRDDCEGSAIVPILTSFTGNGFAAFKQMLVAKLGDVLNDTVPSNYTVPGWNSTSS